MLAVAWVLPAAWVLVVLLSGPTDGTSLASTVVPSASSRWTEGVRIARTYGGTALEPGDEVLLIGERTLTDWLSEGSVDRQVGDVVRYAVRCSGAGPAPRRRGASWWPPLCSRPS